MANEGMQTAALAQGGDLRTRIARGLEMLGPRLGAFWRWWGAALNAWWPTSVRERFGLWPQRLLLQAQGEQLRVTLRRGQVHALGLLDVDTASPLPGDPLAARFPALADVPRWLLVPEKSVLRRRLRLPAAAAERLHDVTGFEIERQTPFASADVVHAARQIAACAEGQIEVELIVLTRAALDAALARLGVLAETVSGVDVAGADGALGINLLPAARRARLRSRSARVHTALVGLTLVLCAAALWQVLDNRRAAVLEWQAVISERSEAAREIAQDERRVLEWIAGAAFLNDERAHRPQMVAIMAELARRLPETTYLDKLAVEAGRITLIGLSADAPALVGQLQASTLWHSPALTGVVQSDAASGLDRFTLVAELATTVTAAGGDDARTP